MLLRCEQESRTHAFLRISMICALHLPSIHLHWVACLAVRGLTFGEEPGTQPLNTRMTQHIMSHLFDSFAVVRKERYAYGVLNQIERLVIATHNRKKGGEMVMILQARFPKLEVKLLADFEGAIEPEETGSTYAENAAIKSESAAQFTNEWSLADDAGLEIDALDGAPGLYSKRFGGEDLPFDQKMARILEMIKDLPAEERGARFRCCIALTPPPSIGGDTLIMEDTCEGQIYESTSGSGGFGYDPIFFLPELGCTMADLTAEQKHEISHRGKVLRRFGDWLESRIK